MRLKMFLMCCSAALSFTHAAGAVDAIVAAEPESMGYVRVCDAFGAGFFFIPGTETCLKVGGHVRFELRAGGLTGGGYGGQDLDGDLDGDSWYMRGRYSFQLSTASDTEVGPLKTFSEIRFTNDNGESRPPIVKFVYIDVAGFRLGKADSAFSAFPGYAADVIADDLISYGPFDTNLISYTYTPTPELSVILSAEFGNAGEFRSYNDDSYPLSRTDLIANYMPNIVGGVKYAPTWGNISAVGAYSSQIEEWVGKVRATFKVNDSVNFFLMAGYSTNHDSGGAETGYSPWGGSWAAWAGGQVKVNDYLTFNAQLSADDFKQFAAVANVNIYPMPKTAPGFRIIPEIEYKDFGDYPLTNAISEKDNLWSGMLRIQRNF